MGVIQKDQELRDEYQELKAELFGHDSFVVEDDSNPKWKRYDQLFAYFNPSFRTDNWVNPLTKKSNQKEIRS